MESRPDIRARVPSGSKTVAEGSERSGGRTASSRSYIMTEGNPEIIALPKCRIIRHDSCSNSGSSPGLGAAARVIIRFARPIFRPARRTRRAPLRAVRRAFLATFRPTRRTLRATLRPVRRDWRVALRETRLAFRIDLPLACLLGLAIVYLLRSFAVPDFVC